MSLLPPRRLLAALLAALSALALATPALAAPPPAPPGHDVGVLTRNLYLGADLTPLVTARTPAEVQAAVGAILQQVVASDPPQRMAWVADEIVAQAPEAVGLQEAALWRIARPDGGTITYDFVQLLLDALAARGANYRVAVAQTNFDSAQQLAGAGLPARFADRDVILVRADDRHGPVSVLDTGGAHYASQLTFPTLLGPVDFERGYVWADLRFHGRDVRFVDTHFEAYPGFGAVPHDYTADQARELVAALPADEPTIVVGDLNSSAPDPLRRGYSVLLAAGLRDAWTAVHPDDPGATCCRDDQLAGGTLTERIDVVLTSGAVTPASAVRLDVDPLRATPPRWPSDHAGVAATLSVGRASGAPADRAGEPALAGR